MTTNNSSYHIPVLLNECLDSLIVKEDGNYLDCTLGGGGHTSEILKRISEKGSHIGIDRDPDVVATNKDLLSKYTNFKIKNIPFSEVIALDEIMFGLKFDGILIDLGISSFQIDNAERGFSYSKDGLLDMRMGKSLGEEFSATDLVNNYTESEMIRIFRNYGEEKFSIKIARNIIKARGINRITTTKELKEIILKSVPYKNNIKSVSRIFQAIRIEVNGELEEIAKFLEFSLDILNSKGRVAIISFHSLEDRIIKNFITEKSQGCICPPTFPICKCYKKPQVKKITRKPITASTEEIEMNVRSRSAKLRVFEKI